MSEPRAAAWDVVGHGELRERLRSALITGRLPQSLLLRGPPGVGKQTLGLWLAALLQCERSDDDPAEAPCGACRSCRLAGRLEHPDIHWHFPLPRPRGSRGKRREALEDARMEELARRREAPWEPPPWDGPTGIYLAAVEEMRSQAARRPAMGRHSVFVIGRAEAMVPQAASPQAANAFLKLLEEPPAHVVLVLTSSRPRLLLATVRSRATELRVRPLPVETVERILRDRVGVALDGAAAAARRSQGSVGRALRLAGGGEDEERARAASLLEAALSPQAGDRLRAAAGFGGRGARGSFSEVLDQLSELLRDAMAVAARHRELAFDRQAADRLAATHALDPEAVGRAVERVEEARGAAAGNVNPQAVTAVLLDDLHRALRGGE